MRRLFFLFMLLFASPALATQFTIHGPDPITVNQGDTLVTSKPLVETLNADGTLTQRSGSGWIDRMNGWPFQITGAKHLKPLGNVTGGYVANGYIYQVTDGIPATPPPPASPLYGINLSWGEFSGSSAIAGALIPAPADMDAYHNVGFAMFRIPFKATQLDTALPKLIALANECIKLKTPCLFDRHEYSWPSVSDQIAFVTKFDALMPKSDYVQLDTMNEPAGFNSTTVTNDWDQWAQDSQAIVTGVRAANITRRLWLEWPGSSGTQRFDKGDRAPKACASAACAMVKLPGKTIVDPLHLTGLEGHRYFDSNGSGTSSTCAQYVILQSAAQQAVPFGMPMMFGEYAFGNDKTIPSTCANWASSIMAEIAASPNLYGVTAWGGGKGWNSGYMFYTPADAASPYVKMIAHH